MKLVRIHPHDQKRGYHTRRFMHKGVRYELNPDPDKDTAFVAVDDETAAELAALRTYPTDPDSKLIFEVKDAPEPESEALVPSEGKGKRK